MNIQEEIAKKNFVEALKGLVRATNPPYIAEQKCQQLEDASHVATILTEIAKHL